MKTISITSGKGGVGKSIATVNLGVELARLGMRVLIFDADMGLANLDILCDVHCDHSLVDFVEGRRTLAELVVDGPGGIKLLPAGSGILKLERLSQAQRINIAAGLNSLSENFDLLLVDTAAGLSENVLFFNSAVDDVVVVLTPDPTSLTDAYALIKIMVTQRGARSVTTVLNRTNSAAEARTAYDKLAGVCDQFLGFTPRYWGHLIQDGALEQAVRLRRPVVLGNPTAAISRCFADLAGRFDEVFPARSSSSDEFWRKVVAQRQQVA